MARSKKKQANDAAGANAKELGVSPGIVASGEMFKEGLIWGTIVTAVAWLGFTFGRRAPEINKLTGEVLRKGNFVHEAAEAITQWHGKFKEGVDWCVHQTGRKVFKRNDVHIFKSITKSGEAKLGEEDTGSAITAASFILGGIGGKLALPGAAMHGRERGLNAGRIYGSMKQKYADASEQNEQLKKDNAILAEDVTRLNAALAEVKRPDINADKETGATRSV